MKGEPDFVIAYGDEKFTSPAKNELPIPTTSVFLRCAKHFRVVLADEHMTGQVRHGCDQNLCPVTNDGRLIRGLQSCGFNHHRIFLPPDHRATLNMAQCLLRIRGEPTRKATRPPMFFLKRVRKGSPTPLLTSLGHEDRSRRRRVDATGPCDGSRGLDDRRRTRV